MKTCPNVRATTWEDQALVLTGPFRGQVAEAGHSQSVSKTPIDGSLNEIGCEEGKRDCLVDLSDAAALAERDGFGTGLGIGHEFLKPTAPPRNRCDQQRAAFGTDGSGFRCFGVRNEYFAAPG
jgi:hypothetical protein